MRLLLTGGRGYIGGRLAQYLSGHGAVPRLASRRVVSPPDWLPLAETVQVDWQSAESLKEACAGQNAIIHLAGLNAQGCAADPANALLVNGVHTARLLETAIAQGVRRFIYFSTAHVYSGSLSGSISEQVCPGNLHPYATSHRAGEDVVRAAHAAGRIDGIVVRLANAVGPPADVLADCWGLLLNDLAREGARTGLLSLRTPGLQQRDFIAMSDVCQMTGQLLTLPGENLGDGLYNMGAGTSQSVSAIAELLAQHFARATGREFVVERPQPKDSSSAVPMNFEVGKLAMAGIAPAKGDALSSEIDGLVRFCLRAFS